MNNYFRITGYCEEKDFCFIVDCYGYYDKLWQVSADFVGKGMKIIAVGAAEKFLDGNITPMEYRTDYMLARATCNGRPIETTFTVEGVTYKALKVNDKIYVPDRTQIA